MKDGILKQLLYLLLGLVIFLICYEGIPLIYKAVIIGKILPKNPSGILSEIINCSLEIVIFTVLFIIHRKTILSDYKKLKTDIRKNLNIGFKYYFIGFIVMAASNILLGVIFGGIAENEEVNRQIIKIFPVYSILAMIVLGPMIEELIFRLGFRKAFKKWLPYAIFSALFFGGLHVYTAYRGMNLSGIIKNWHEMLYIVPYGALGFAFAKTYFETDNIWTSIIIHTLHNAFTILLIFSSMR